MAVAWVQTITQWGVFGGGSSTSGSFTPTVGDCIVVFELEVGSSVAKLSITGTGVYSPIIDKFNPVSTDVYYGAANLNCSGSAQTVTVHSTVSADLDGWAFEYSGAGDAAASRVLRNTPGTVSGAITGNSVVVPTGSVLLAICIGNLSTTITSPTGTNRGSGAASTGQAWGWCTTEYAGAGSAIQPTFTDATNGAFASYVVLQVVISPAIPQTRSNAPVMQTHGPSINKYLNFDASHGTARLLFPFIQPPLTLCNSVAVLQTHHPSGPRQLNQDTSHGVPKTLYSDVASPRAPVLQNQPVRRDVTDTSQGSALALLLVQAPATGPPAFAPQPYAWLPADTTQGTALLLRVAVVQAPFQNAPAPVPPQYPWLPDDTSQSALALLSGDFFVPTFNPPQFQVDRIRPVVDTSSTLPKALYGDALIPAFDAPQHQVDRIRPVTDTSRGSPPEEIQAPIANPPWFAPLKFWWQPADASQSTPKVLYADALTPAFNPPAHQVDRIRPVVDTSSTLPKALYADAARPAFNPPQFQVDPVRPVYDTSHSTPAEEIQPPIANAPTLLVDRVRPVTDTSQSSPLAVLTAQAPFTAEPGWAPIRFWWQPADTSQATPKPLYADALAAVIPPVSYQIDRLRPVVDTTQSSPLALLGAPQPFTAEPGWAPAKVWWQPEDTSQSTPKPLYSDALRPAFDAPQFQVDRVRPVVDTSLAEPKALYADQFKPVFDAPQYQVDRIRPVVDTTRGAAIEEIQAPLANPPWFAPQRYPWLPADTCQSVPKALYADLFRSFFNPPPYQIDPVRPVYDTGRGSPADLAQAPIANPPWFAPQRFWWQPPDTSASTAKPLYADLFAARVDAPQFLVDAVRPVIDTSRSTPAVLIPVQAPFIAEPWCPPLRFFWQPLDTSQSTPKVGYADLNRAIEPPPAYQVDRVRPVVDTSQSMPVAITAIRQPFQVLPQPAPARYWWQPADSSQSIPKTLTADQFRPVFDAPQFQVDRIRPVTDTSQPTAPDLIQPPLFNAPWFAPLKFWWQPPDTSQATPKAAYGDLYHPAIPPASYQVDRVRPVTDTSHPTPGAFVPPVPVVNPPGFVPLRFWWQPADTSQGAPPTLTLVPFVYGNDIGQIIPSRSISAVVDDQWFMLIPSRQISGLIPPVQTFTFAEEE
jgi:hypothetical protein